MAALFQHDSECVNIVCCTDQKYLPLTVTMLSSLVQNRTPGTGLNLYIIHDIMDETLRHQADQYLSCEQVHCHWREVCLDDLYHHLDIPTTYSKISCHYYRLLTPYLLPQSAQKAIYLDVDLVILDDIVDLWQTPFNGHLICAVRDFLGTFGASILDPTAFGIDPAEKYFNSGVLLIDLAQWRAQDISKRVMACRLANEAMVQAGPHYSYDQFGLNIILHRQWQELDRRWNYPPGPGIEPLRHPAIAHYYGDIKPWKPKCDRAFRQHFIHHFTQIPAPIGAGLAALMDADSYRHFSHQCQTHTLVQLSRQVTRSDTALLNPVA